MFKVLGSTLRTAGLSVSYLHYAAKQEIGKIGVLDKLQEVEDKVRLERNKKKYMVDEIIKGK